jgi:hypothetical protein
MKRLLAVVAAMLFALQIGFSGAAFAKTKADATFAFPKDKPIKIILFRPDMEVASLGASGVPTPNPDWTADSRKFIAEALKETAGKRNIEIAPIPELSGDDAAYAAEYQSLYRAVANSMMIHNYVQKLPTKKLPAGSKAKYAFDWTLGPGTKKLAELGGGNYGLFIYGYDAYATSGRKVMQIFMLVASSALGGGFFPQGGQHFSYASLVDLDTGNIVWFNFYANKKGDIRERAGAQERADTLLSTLPLREGEVAPKTVRKRS